MSTMMLPLPEGLTPEDVIALKFVAAELAGQRNREQFGAAHDDHHTDGSLAAAGGCYLLHAGATDEGRSVFPTGHPCDLFPWASPWWKPKDRIRDAVRGTALGAAEISRRLRAGEKAEG